MLKRIVIGVALLFSLFLGYGFYVSNTPEGLEKTKQRDAIKYCWDVWSKKSNDAAVKIFAANACEQMEAQFTAKWGVKP